MATVTRKKSAASRSWKNCSTKAWIWFGRCDAYLAINSKRVDLLIIDAEFRPLHAVEFQGKGHHQGTAAARDAVKKEALRRAGIGYVEVVSGDTPAHVREMVRRLVGRR